MEDQSSSVLSIFSFGNFVVKKGNEKLNQAQKKSSKRWKLLSYLITHRERNVSREELIFNLNLNANDNPQSSLSALVYRLRKILRTDKNNREYLKTCGSAYTFNLKTNYWFDSEELEKFLLDSKEAAEKSLDRSEQLFNKALNLYKGDYLEEFQSQEWIWNFRNKYKEQLINTLLKLDPLFKKENKYLKLWHLYNKLQQKINFDERLLKNSIKVLIKAGNINTAREKYNELISMYKNNDLMIPDSIKNLESQLNSNGLELTKEISYNQIEEDSDGAYICKDRNIFKKIYKLEKRRLDRDKRPRCISHLRLKFEMDQDKMIKFSQNFLELLADQLRAGDLICHWRIKHYNILLMDIKKKEAEKVIKRIKRYFNSKFSFVKSIDIKSKIYQL